MSAGAEFLYWGLLCLIGGGAYVIYEIRHYRKSRRTNHLIRESRYFQQGREIRSSHDCWEIEGRRVR